MESIQLHTKRYQLTISKLLEIQIGRHILKRERERERWWVVGEQNGGDLSDL
jgi:hypothetical protein